MLQYFVLIGAPVQLLGTLTYLKGTIQGKIKPNRITWFFWAVSPAIGVVAALSDGVRLAVVPVFMAGFGPLLVFIASFVNPKSFWKLGVFDWICGGCALIAIILWYMTKDPMMAIIFAIIGDAAAALPTIIKSWKKPESELALPFLASIVCELLGLLAINTWTPTSYAFPFYLISLNTLLCLVISRKKLFGVRERVR